MHSHTLEVQRLFVERFFWKDYCFSKDYLSTIAGTILLMVFDFQGIAMAQIVPKGPQY